MTTARWRILMTLLALKGVDGAQAQSAEDFSRRTPIGLVLAHAVGGDYDTIGRLVAAHIGRHIPGQPKIVVQNMAGASTIIATNYLYRVAPKDGSVIGSFSRNIPISAATGVENLAADPRHFGWLGGLGLMSRVCAASRATNATGLEELRSRTLVMGSTGSGSSQSLIPTVLNRVLGTRFKVVEGYTGTPQIFLAIERGEIEGMCHSWSVFESSHADAVASGKIKILFHLGELAFPEMPDLPSAFQYSNTEQKQYLRFVFSGAELGRPFVAPPGVPEDRLQVLRLAFRNMTADPAFLAAAEKAKLDVRLRTPQDLMALVDELFAIPQEQISRIKAVMPQMRD